MATLTHEEKNKLMELLAQKGASPVVAAQAVEGLSSTQAKALTALVGNMSSVELVRLLDNIADAKKAGEQAFEAWFQKNVVEAGSKMTVKPSASQIESQASPMPTTSTQYNFKDIVHNMNAAVILSPLMQAISNALKAAGFKVTANSANTVTVHNGNNTVAAKIQQSPQGQMIMVGESINPTIARAVTNAQQEQQQKSNASIAPVPAYYICAEPEKGQQPAIQKDYGDGFYVRQVEANVLRELLAAENLYEAIVRLGLAVQLTPFYQSHVVKSTVRQPELDINTVMPFGQTY